MTRRVTVLGAGVVGLSIAHELATRGAAVTVVSDRPATDSVSAVAAAIWFPYGSEGSEQVKSWLVAAYARFSALAEDPRTGVDLREGTVVERTSTPDRSWTDAVPASQEATPQQLPVGALSGVRTTVPVISMGEYLVWLLNQCHAQRVSFRTASVHALDELSGQADLVVVAAGMRSGALLGDESMFPVRGQVVRLANAGLTDWITDNDNPAGLTYVVPRRHDVVCGGTAHVGSWDQQLDPPDAGRHSASRDGPRSGTGRTAGAVRGCRPAAGGPAGAPRTRRRLRRPGHRLLRPWWRWRDDVLGLRTGGHRPCPVSRCAPR